MRNRRKRYQQGSLTNVKGLWIAQWREEGHHRKRVLGKTFQMTKSEARSKLKEILDSMNGRLSRKPEQHTFSEFVEQTYLPFYRRKWKLSTAFTNEERLRFHLVSEFGPRNLDTLTLHELQSFLVRKAGGLSYNVVNHLRWDLNQVLGLAFAEGYLHRNPAAMLFAPKEARHTVKRVMTAAEVRLLLSILNLREQLICTLAVICGMRPGEIFGLKWQHVMENHIEVKQRIYRGRLDSPKTTRSERKVGLSNDAKLLFATWKSNSPRTTPADWVFPSEKFKTPLRKDNCWRRDIGPRLKKVRLEWANFQVMRRTHASLRRPNVEPKVVADQLGHSVDVNLNVYAQSPLEARIEAVNALEAYVNQQEVVLPIA